MSSEGPEELVEQPLNEIRIVHGLGADGDMTIAFQFRQCGTERIGDNGEPTWDTPDWITTLGMLEAAKDHYSCQRRGLD